MEENKTKKEYPKYRNYSLWILVVILLVAWFIGRNVFLDASRIFGNNVWIFALVSLIATYILNSLLYELGKCLFGWIAGYRLNYLNFFGITFQRAKGKTRIVTRAWENYGTRTVMAPKHPEEKTHPALYLLGGSIFTAVLNIAILVTCVLISTRSYDTLYQCCAYVQCMIGLIVLVLNLAPFLSDGLSDGFLLRLILTSPESRRIFHDNLYQEEALYTGKHDLKEVTYEDDHNLLAVRALIYQYYYHVHTGNLQAAEQSVLRIFDVKEYAMEEDVLTAYSLKYFFLLLRGGEEKISEEYWALPKSQRKYCSSYASFETLKTALLIASLIDLNYDLYEYITTKIDKRKSDYDLIYRSEDEEKLIQLALHTIEKRKPEWFGAYEDGASIEETADDEK